jgi:hypothetical protein
MPNLSRSRIIIVVSILVVVGAFCPYQTSVVPTWNLLVVDQQTRPYPAITVTEAWKNYTLDTEPGQNFDVRQTDKNGHVEFPEKTIRASLAKRLLLTSYSALMVLAHGGFGIQAYVHASGPQGYAEVKYVPGKPPPDRLVLPSH